jgi:hypothetical protein
MSGGAELVLKKRGTKALIDEDPIIITITRKHKDPNQRGGATRGVTVLDPQRVRILHEDLLHEVNAPASISASRVVKYRDAVLGIHTADLEVDDVFEAENTFYRITAVNRDQEYRVIANIEAQGATVG